MISLFDGDLSEIDKRITSVRPAEVPVLFRSIPLDIFGQLLLDVPPRYPSLKAFFPAMPSIEVQTSWTGAHGEILLGQSLAFVKSLIFGYTTVTRREIREATILDYGCGWGRLLRLLYKLTSIENIYGVDPWDKSIELCRQQGLKGNLALSDWVPRTLPFKREFDLIFGFSVFTHLSQKTGMIVLETLRKHIARNGMLAITIRPKEYWLIHEGGRNAQAMINQHDTMGFAFFPHNRAPIDGDITYGDASMSLQYLSSRIRDWKIAGLDYNLLDHHQVIVFLQPA
jgi:trans-aconitate methyltransferase